ncbi:MAG: BtpA/SgcQ family protein [Halanaerobiaceae bacterium]
MVKWKEDLEKKRISSLKDEFGVEKPVIGMVHLQPLPGSVPYKGQGVEPVIEAALEDAEKLIEGGADAIMVENMWDVPYHVKDDMPPAEMTSQAVAAYAIKQEYPDIPMGINVVHNGGKNLLSIAVASGADFIRVCLLTGAQVWDTGEFDNGVASDLLEYRKYLGAEDIKLLCDVDKKHSVRFPGIDLETHIEWTEFYLSDAIIISGKMTGAQPTVDKVKKASELSDRPILLGSGTNADNIGEFLKYADGAIVGTSLKVNGIGENPVDLDRVKEYMSEVRKVRNS